jgi:hypothetical protein
MVGDIAMLSGKNIKTRRPSKKFDVKMYGPFEVIKAVLPTAYRLKLSKIWSNHLTFYISLLEPYQKSIDSNRLLPDLDQVLADADLLDSKEGQKIKEIKDS